MNALTNNIENTKIICRLGMLNQQLIRRSINLNLEVKQLQQIDQQLLWLLHKSKTFDLVEQIMLGRTLLVGEGNLSFALNLAHDERITPRRLIATTYEKSGDLSEEAIENAANLKSMGVTVLNGVDATQLSSIFGSWLFDSVIFQFPHTGSREAIEGRNPNFILVRDFLKSASTQLARRGQVLITAVDSPHYRGAFQFEEAAEIAGFKAPEVYPYKPSHFEDYEHTMTHEDGDALFNHKKFGLWVFKR